jgi:hypothetical protein
MQPGVVSNKKALKLVHAYREKIHATFALAAVL